MKIVKVPVQVTAKVNEGPSKFREVAIPFKEWLQNALDSFEPFAKGGLKMARRSNKLAEIIEAANGEMKFEDAEYDDVKAAVESWTYPPAFKRQIISYYEAIEQADTQVPSVEERAEAAKRHAQDARV